MYIVLASLRAYTASFIARRCSDRRAEARLASSSRATRKDSNVDLQCWRERNRDGRSEGRQVLCSSGIYGGGWCPRCTMITHLASHPAASRTSTAKMRKKGGASATVGPCLLRSSMCAVIGDGFVNQQKIFASTLRQICNISRQ